MIDFGEVLNEQNDFQDELGDDQRKKRRPLGQLNGKWVTAWKMDVATRLSLLPFVLAWAIWVTSNTYQASSFRESTERFAQEDARLLRQEMHAELEQRWRDIQGRLESQDAKFAEIRSELSSIRIDLNAYLSRSGRSD